MCTGSAERSSLCSPPARSTLVAKAEWRGTRESANRMNPFAFHARCVERSPCFCCSLRMSQLLANICSGIFLSLGNHLQFTVSVSITFFLMTPGCLFNFQQPCTWLPTFMTSSSILRPRLSGTSSTRESLAMPLGLGKASVTLKAPFTERSVEHFRYSLFGQLYQSVSLYNSVQRLTHVKHKQFAARYSARPLKTFSLTYAKAQRQR